MDAAALEQALARSISAERLAGYYREVAPGTTTGVRPDPDPLNAVARYQWNTALCEALYPSLQAFEVALRNAVHESLSEYYRPDWLQTAAFLRPQEQERVRAAEDALRAQGKPITPGRLVAELTLGFWTGLFVHAYDRTVALPVMARRLRAFPSSLRTRRALYPRFEDVRFLRNRVFHFEPIWYWSDLPQRHANLVADLGYLSPEKQRLVTLLDRFPAVHTAGWTEWRTRLEQDAQP